MRRASMTCQGRNLLPCSHHQLHVHQLLLPYLKSTTNYRQQGWPIVYIHEMYIYASHTQPQFCGDRTIGPSCTCSEGSSKLYLSMLDIKSWNDKQTFKSCLFKRICLTPNCSFIERSKLCFKTDKTDAVLAEQYYSVSNKPSWPQFKRNNVIICKWIHCHKQHNLQPRQIHQSSE